MSKKWGIAFRPARRLKAKFEFFSSEFDRNLNASALKKSGMRVRKIVKKVV
jgi:hypothetical protein